MLFFTNSLVSCDFDAYAAIESVHTHLTEVREKADKLLEQAEVRFPQNSQSIFFWAIIDFVFYASFSSKYVSKSKKFLSISIKSTH